MQFRIYNTLTRSIEEFKPINPPHVSLYTCGLTVYDFAHLGHMRKYTNDDILKRALTYNDFKVTHVQNVTDVGHLVSDEDEGEDKMEKGAKKTGKTAWEVAKYYEELGFKDFDLMNILRPDVISRATEHIPEQIDLIKKLEKKGFTYETSDGVYFDTSKFEEYGKLSGQKLSDKLEASREEMKANSEKRNPADFALWKKRVGEHVNHTMHWDSPWGDGFPGWHIECSAMAMKYLGEHLDIHTGGVDHIAVHHENEIAQSEAATGQKFANYWVHHEFLLVDGQKMSKSLGNFFTLQDVLNRGFSPMDLRYLILGTHYRQKLNFTWEALDGARNSRHNLISAILKLDEKNAQATVSGACAEKFAEAINDDLNLPKALAVVWEAARYSHVLRADIFKFDHILGLNLESELNVTPVKKNIPQEVLELASRRDSLRAEKKFAEADKIREQIESRGFLVKDTPDGTKVE